MKVFMTAAMGFGLVLTSALAVGQEAPKAAAELQTQKQKLSYLIGVDLGGRLKRQSVNVDLDIVMQGIKDALAGKVQLNEEQIRQTLTAYQQEMQEAVGKKIKAGEDFLAENKTKPGVVTLPDGLQYKVEREGTGRTPKATDTVTVNYEGRLVDGTVFDSSYKRGQPASFEVDRVIRGWSEALQLMKEGAKWQLVIPPDLAYGPRPPAGTPIYPNAVLIFDVELLNIQDSGAQSLLPGH